jgi:hypothetical protein
VHPLELAGLAPVAAPLREQLSILARKRVDLAIGAVGDENESLLRIDRRLPATRLLGLVLAVISND